jgi:hypothetical protein
LNGTFVVVNAGHAEAIIRESEYRFFWSNNGLPMTPPLSPGHATSPIFTEHPYTMAGHESHNVTTSSNTAPTQNELNAIRGGAGSGWRFYILGAIRFSDWNPDKERWMGFCRVFVPADGGGSGSEGRFMPVNNGDYEYED